MKEIKEVELEEGESQQLTTPADASHSNQLEELDGDANGRPSKPPDGEEEFADDDGKIWLIHDRKRMYPGKIYITGISVKFSPETNACAMHSSAKTVKTCEQCNKRNVGGKRRTKCTQTREIMATMERNMAIASHQTNSSNFLCFTRVGIPWSESSLWHPPGIVNPAANVTVVTRVATTRRVLALFLYQSIDIIL
ncbi:hypothetical protein IFM89_025236 [Coptis chinensis]|uniref:Uncharacterized protein n=1 Tax=Coptis chinensis TaxID=261450 RepID=A0A835H0W6_9MAGN|nr:hypothetical protein IFM89_025236 [Coptis chinensis]